MMRILLTCAILCSLTAFGQLSDKHPANLVSAFAEQSQFNAYDLLEPVQNKTVVSIPDELENFEILQLNQSEVNRAASDSPVGLNLPLRLGNDLISLDLVRVDPFAPGFTVTVEPSGQEFIMNDLGTYYRGTVHGQEGSIAALSIVNGEVSALISRPNDEGNVILGKLDNSAYHILYKDKDIKDEFDFTCEVPSYEAVKDFKIQTEKRATVNCPEIYIDLGNDVHNNKGGVAGATNYINQVFNQVALLYANDDIDIALAGVTVWASPEPFLDSGNIFNTLDDYGAYRSSNPVAGDLNAYVNYASSGGVAWVGGLCGNKFSVSGIQSGFATVPTYSWTVEVFTHELGHNLGSPHTHACAWNGNNTAIDGCGPASGNSEGCDAGLPSNGGTIMSYCHLTGVGINFTLGFGPQPQARIASYIDSAPCVGNCVAPTCDDGVQNGAETGVDCGGPDCDECPPCPYDEISLDFVFDDYPEETSWTITDDAGAVMASGGTYAGQADGSSLTELICLADGCYDFNIFDSYGDGICCAYGTGSYLLTDASGATLASGGEFTSSESVSFCISSEPSEDCSVYDTAPVDLTKSFDPVNGLQDRVQVKWFKASPEVRYNSQDNAACDIEYWAYRYKDGPDEPWINIPTAERDTSLLPYTTVKKTNNNPLFKWPLKFRLNSGANQVLPNHGYRWRVRCYCEQGALIDGQQVISPWSEVKFFNTPDFDPSTGIYTDPGSPSNPGAETKSLDNDFKVNLYPNPTDGVLNITYKTRKGDDSFIQVMDMFGKVVYSENVLGSGGIMRLELGLSDLAVGNYILMINNDLQTSTERFAVSR